MSIDIVSLLNESIPSKSFSESNYTTNKTSLDEYFLRLLDEVERIQDSKRELKVKEMNEAFYDHKNNFEESTTNSSTPFDPHNSHISRQDVFASTSPSWKDLKRESTRVARSPLNEKTSLTGMVDATTYPIIDPASLDPTPIGNQGVIVVEKVPIIEPGWVRDEVMIDYLRPLLKRKTNTEDSVGRLSQRNSINDSQCTKISVFNSTLPSKRQKLMDDEEAQRELEPGASPLGQNLNEGSSRRELNIRTHQNEQWNERFSELVKFQQENGHCVVPYHYKQNIPLALWVKRQRHQYKLKKEGSHSTMTDDREMALESLGFVWDSHKASWEERLNELIEFRNRRGHCNVPAKFDENPQLAIWVKCQRRQYKLFRDGEKSNMTAERIERLSREGFVWNPRSKDEF